MKEDQGTSARRFIVNDVLTAGAFELPPDQARHASRVLRLRVGDAILLFDARGHEIDAHIVAIDKDRVCVETSGGMRERPAEIPIVLGQGIPKGKKMDAIVRHGTELGVTVFQPLLLSRCIPRLEAERVDTRLRRWKRIAEEACRQCRRTDIPSVEAPLSLEAFCALFTALPQAGGILLYENAADAPLLPCIEHMVDSGAPIWIVIGPEGGLEPDEVDRARAAGFQVAGLGPSIVRTQTASLAALAGIRLVREARRTVSKR